MYQIVTDTPDSTKTGSKMWTKKLREEFVFPCQLLHEFTKGGCVDLVQGVMLWKTAFFTGLSIIGSVFSVISPKNQSVRNSDN